MLEIAQMDDDVMLNENVPDFEAPASIAVVTGLNLNSGTPVMTGFIPVGLILNNFEIPYYEHGEVEGYQRHPQLARVNRLASDLRTRGVDTPTALLLNIRQTEILNFVDTTQPMSQLLATSILKGMKFYIVDGQHRILGYEKAINDGWHEGMNKLIPFTCMLGAVEAEEMKQFHVVNSTAKSVKTDLAFALLKRRGEQEEHLLEALQGQGQDWQVQAQTIVEELAISSKIWKGKIRLPSMPSGGTTIPSASMVNSMKSVIGSPFFSRLDDDRKYAVIEAYWGGVRAALPAAFSNAGSYSIQKGIGVSTLHDVLPEVVELVRHNGESVTDADAYEKVLSPALAALNGENQSGEEVAGVDFWKAGEEGAAGSYSSGAGKRVLVAKFRSALGRIGD